MELFRGVSREGWTRTALFWGKANEEAGASSAMPYAVRHVSLYEMSGFERGASDSNAHRRADVLAHRRWRGPRARVSQDKVVRGAHGPWTHSCGSA
jgi:hypothetical protein